MVWIIMKEETNAQFIKLQAAQDGVLLWRNNSGAFYDDKGALRRFGLGNTSAKLNKKVKSSDYIGITPVKITLEMVGQTIGVFTAVETKPSDWKFDTKDERSVAQLKFIDIVLEVGGYAGFARNNEEYKRIVRK